MTKARSGPRGGRDRGLARALAWAATAGCVGLSLGLVSWSEVLRELARRDWRTTATIGFAAPFALSFVIAACDRAILRHAAPPGPSYEEVLRARAATAALPFGGASGGGYFLWLKTVVRGGSALAAFACIGAGEIGAICLVTLATLPLAACAGVPLPYARIAALSGTVAALLVAGVVVARRAPSACGAFGRTARAVPPIVFARTIAGHAAKIAVLVAATWCAATAFGLALPLSAVAVYVPIVMLAGFLPLSVAGFGATQLAWLLFVDFAPAEQLLAFQLIWNAAQVLGRLACGAPFMSRVLGASARGGAATAA